MDKLKYLFPGRDTFCIQSHKQVVSQRVSKISQANNKIGMAIIADKVDNIFIMYKKKFTVVWQYIRKIYNSKHMCITTKLHNILCRQMIRIEGKNRQSNNIDGDFNAPILIMGRPIIEKLIRKQKTLKTL